MKNKCHTKGPAETIKPEQPRSRPRINNNNDKVNKRNTKHVRKRRKKLCLTGPYLRDLGGGDPYEHDGDDEDEPSPVLEIGTHTHAAATRSASPAAVLREEEEAAEASNLTARVGSWGVEFTCPATCLRWTGWVSSAAPPASSPAPSSLPTERESGSTRRRRRTVLGAGVVGRVKPG